MYASTSAVSYVNFVYQAATGWHFNLRTREGNRIIRSREMEALLLKNSRPIRLSSAANASSLLLLLED